MFTRKTPGSEQQEPSADFPGLVDLVLNEKSGMVEFWRFNQTGQLSFDVRSVTGLKAAMDKSIVNVAPDRRALPWELPRAAQVTHFLEADDDASYFAALQLWIGQHVDLADSRLVVFLAAWIAHTYLVDLCAASPYVVLLGPPETGKSRTLAACIHPARRGILTMTPREAALIRYADECKATIALDTVDFMTQIRNTKDFFAARTKNDGTLTTRVLDFRKGPFQGMQHYHAFGPTMIASNTPLSDEVISSRSLVIQACQSKRRFLVNITADLARELRERGTAFRARVLQRHEVSQLPPVPDVAEGRLGDMMSGLAWAVQICAPEALATLRELTTTFAAARRTEAADLLEVDALRVCIEMATKSETGKEKLSDFVNAFNDDRTGERALSSRKLGPILRTSLGLDVTPGAGNYRYVHLNRARLKDLAARYGLKSLDEP
jgi:hypothetical protein